MAAKKNEKAHVVRRTDEELDAQEKAEKKRIKDASAVENEALEVETVIFTVEINGKDIEIETVADIMDADVQVIIDHENKRFASMLMALLGDAQWAKLRAAGMTARDMTSVVLPAWQEATGLGED